MPDRVIKRHDTAQQPRARLEDETGTALDLTGASVVYTLRNVESGVLKINRASAGIADQLTDPGEVYYQLLTTDVDTTGVYAEEWEVTYSGGGKETFPVGALQLVRIEDDADNI